MKAKLVLKFRVDGVAQPRGSKKPIMSRGRRPGRVIDDNPESGPWMDVVRFYARIAMRDAGHRKPFDGPLCLTVIIFRERPADHFRANGDVKPTAPAFPDTRPDASKYLRAIEDAMSKVVYVDDSRIVDSYPSKRWGTKPGVLIKLYRLPATVADLKR